MSYSILRVCTTKAPLQNATLRHPPSTYPKEKALLFLPDFLGVTFRNAQLIADDFAQNGYSNYLTKATAPLLINLCEIDPPFPPDFQASAGEILKTKFVPEYHREHWVGCKHELSVRGDIQDPMVKAAKEESFVNAVEWLNEYV
ncbi:hypothetical protein CONPUDRAFT_166845 [Coniophora puteana RWD-64-598 SS2]|uniref:Dienelactone hydrolase domain-containing protein n=1 Tax=Coniophora puteana (strain RWD-64-598) TaxID=741705 RepID=A0A5M3MID8_CONPW|nr:uncharacterized protein CONPUDRAFT_166845 [Coniophora puteana RWD-64-598 SS2]EIW79009.1 hypothetical protein CONPUDRAFT_166845 [Coniophora puteana RWD-64-598 SS2]